MKTALRLCDYEDVLDPAFIKLESVESLSQEQKNAYEELALEIFTKHSPKILAVTRPNAPAARLMIPDWSQVCPNCDTKFPTCIVTGRPLMDYQFWMCGTCKHRAYEQEINALNHCPLCHAPI
ncbi:WD repeat-containing protein 35 [Desmophyllum pertusum]|uniref:WD repeat-containing protein 35 n=1 Tax=Desmophyllum pertusum TaxID=174260 RepID=A0A9X0D5X2_9CNID|nr:WD repeat-containing protein 35 [Desmophyllum pertusum]